MKLSCLKKQLQETVHTVSRAVSSRSTLPILNNILIEVSEEHAWLSATDLEVGIRQRIPLETAEEGGTTIPARFLGEVLNSLPEAPVTIESDERELITITCEKSFYEIHGLPADEFPIIPEVTSENTLTLKQPLLRELIRQTVFAASTDETRAILTGALLILEGQTISLVATDTHRLALRSSTLEEPMQLTVSGDIIIPARTLNELYRLLQADEEAEVRLDIAENQIQFTLDDTILLSRLIEGQFPNYKKVIPTEYERCLVLDTDLFHNAVRRCAIVARENAYKVILRTTPEGELTITADSHKVGRAEESIPVELEGEPVEIAFNAQYLLDVLGIIDSETVRFELGGPLNPGAIRPVGEVDYVYVLMPMQII